MSYLETYLQIIIDANSRVSKASYDVSHLDDSKIRPMLKDNKHLESYRISEGRLEITFQ